MLRALFLSALVLLCSAASPLAQERHIATYGGMSGSLAPHAGHIRAGGIDKDVTTWVAIRPTSERCIGVNRLRRF